MASEFVEYLRSGLAARGLTAYRLAGNLGKARTTIYRVFKDDMAAPVGEDLIREMASTLGLDPEWAVILSGEQHEPGSLRWKYSQTLRRLRAYREENQVLRQEIDQLRAQLPEEAPHG